MKEKKQEIEWGILRKVKETSEKKKKKESETFREEEKEEKEHNHIFAISLFFPSNCLNALNADNWYLL